MKQLFTTSLALLLLLAASCKKEEPINYDNYPNRLTCKINGQSWEPQGTDGPFGAPYFNVEYTSSSGHLRIFAYNNTKMQVLYLGIDSLESGANNFNFNDVVWGDDLHPIDTCDTYKFDPLHANEFILDEIDYEHKIIKGRFYFTLVNNCGEKLTFLDGILDIKPFWYE